MTRFTGVSGLCADRDPSLDWDQSLDRVLASGKIRVSVSERQRLVKTLRRLQPLELGGAGSAGTAGLSDPVPENFQRVLRDLAGD